MEQITEDAEVIIGRLKVLLYNAVGYMQEEGGMEIDEIADYLGSTETELMEYDLI